MSKIEEVVREKYGAVAASDLTGDHARVRAVAEAFGYKPEDLDAIPAGENIGLSCGNPTATANCVPARSWWTSAPAAGSTCSSRRARSGRRARRSGST